VGPGVGLLRKTNKESQGQAIRVYLFLFYQPRRGFGPCDAPHQLPAILYWSRTFLLEAKLEAFFLSVGVCFVTSGSSERVVQPMKPTSDPDVPIQNLLDRLKQKPDDQVAVTTLMGRALSRSADKVHLAFGGGLVAIPVANIQRVISVSSSHPDVVRLVVRNPEDIQSLLEVTPVAVPPTGRFGQVKEDVDDDDDNGDNGDDAEGGYTDTIPTDRNSITGYGVGVSTCTWSDTDTITGGEADAVDDYPAHDCHADDEDG
jgi:hypothetical protein